MEKIIIRAFRAIDEPETCREFAAQHARVLTDLGVAEVVVPDDSWSRDPFTTVFVAEHQTLGLVAGIRLERAVPGHQLRMQECLFDLAPSIVPVLDDLQPHGNAELCGLWNAHRFAGRGVPWLLINAAVATASQLQLRSIVTFIAEYVAPYADRTGFVPIRHIGDNGAIIYPVPSIKTIAMIHTDLVALASVKADVRQRMLSLRMRPRQLRVEQPKTEEILVLYKLIMDHSLQVDFQEVLQTRRLFAA